MALSNLRSIFDATQMVAPVPIDDLDDLEDSSSDMSADVGRGSTLRRLGSGSLALIAVGLVVTTGRSIIHPSTERLPIGEMPSIFSLIEMNDDLAPYFTRTTDECSAYLQKAIAAQEGAPYPPCESRLKRCTVTTSLKIRQGFHPMFVTRDPKVEKICVPSSCRSEDLKADMTSVLKAQLEKKQSRTEGETIIRFGALDISNCEGDSLESEQGHGPSIVV